MMICWYLCSADDDVAKYTWVFPVPGAGVLVKSEQFSDGDGDENGTRTAESMVFVPGVLIEVDENNHGYARAPEEGEENKIGRVVKAS